MDQEITDPNCEKLVGGGFFFCNSLRAFLYKRKCIQLLLVKSTLRYIKGDSVSNSERLSSINLSAQEHTEFQKDQERKSLSNKRYPLQLMMIDN